MSDLLIRSLPGNIITRYLKRTIADILPSTLKRAFVVSSALAVVTKNKNPDTQLLDSLDRFLNLGYRPEIMAFPAFIGGYVWKDLDVSALGNYDEHGLRLAGMSDKDCWHAAVVLAKSCPECLNYGSIQLMATDLRNLIKVIYTQTMPVMT